MFANAITALMQDGSDSKDLCSEQQIVQEISSYASTLLAITRFNEAFFSHRRLSKLRSALNDLEELEGLDDLEKRLEDLDSAAFSETWQEIAALALIANNLQNREEEPEDFVLATSDLLPWLLARARQEPPSLDWERDLNEL